VAHLAGLAFIVCIWQAEGWSSGLQREEDDNRDDFEGGRFGSGFAHDASQDFSFMIRVAIIEDDPLVRASLNEAFAQADGLAAIGQAQSVAEGTALVEAGGYDVLICDLGLPDGDGTGLVGLSAARYPAADVLVLTMFADHHKVLAAIRAGARGYLLKDQITTDCIAAIKEVRAGGSPISPIIARLLLVELGLKKDGAEQARPQRGQDHKSAVASGPPAVSLASEEPAVLSNREVETLHLLARGFTYAECADLLGISPHTVGTHVKHIYRKLEVSSRAEAVFEAASLGLLDPH
jgi:DNA-binding NarL/FixJ family response regulator